MTEVLVPSFVGGLGISLWTEGDLAHDPILAEFARAILLSGNGTLLRDSSFESMRSDVLGERRLIVDFAGDAAGVEIEGASVRNRDGRSVTSKRSTRPPSLVRSSMSWATL